MTIKLLSVALLTLAPSSGTLAAEPASWPSGFAKVIAAQSTNRPTNMNLSKALSPYVVFDAVTCATARLPTAASQVPITSALISFEDSGACHTPTPLAALQFYIEASSIAQIAGFKSSLAADLPPPCFKGQIAQTDTRRHAPPRNIVAWRTNAETIVLASEQGIDGAAALSLLVRPSGTETLNRYGEDLRNAVSKGLPAACL